MALQVINGSYDSLFAFLYKRYRKSYKTKQNKANTADFPYFLQTVFLFITDVPFPREFYLSYTSQEKV